MPHLTILGIKRGTKTKAMKDMLRLSLSKIEALGITTKNVFIFCPMDADEENENDNDKNLIVVHAVLFETSKRTPEVRKEFADTVTEVVQIFHPKSMVKCMPNKFDCAEGYSTREPIPDAPAKKRY